MVRDDHAPSLSSLLSITKAQARERRRAWVFAYMERETMKIRLEPVTVASRAAVERLETAPGQEGFVESVAECLAEADRRRCWRPVGVYDGDALIGFAMYGFFWEYLPFGRLWLDRLLIDKKYQGKGYGKRVVLALLDRLRTEYSCDTIYLSVYETNSHAIHLYQQIGFHFNGEYDTNGEHVMVYAF